MKKITYLAAAVFLAAQPAAAVQASEAITENMPYSLYKILLYNADKQFGQPELKEINDRQVMLDGVCFARLADFNQDGYDDLVYVYETNDAQALNGSYTFEIWYSDGQSVWMGDSGELYGSNGGVQALCMTEYEGVPYVVTGLSAEGSVNRYHGYGENGFGIVREAVSEWDSDIGEFTCTIDGQAVPKEQWDAEQAAWDANLVSYQMNLDSQSAQEALQVYHDTRKRLGLEEDEPEDTGDDYLDTLNDCASGLAFFDDLIGNNYEYDNGALLYSLTFSGTPGNVTASLGTFSSGGTGTGGEYFEIPLRDGTVTYDGVATYVAGMGMIRDNNTVVIIPGDGTVGLSWTDAHGKTVVEADFPLVYTGS